MGRAILLIDGDNVAGNYAEKICELAESFGEVSERHLFANAKSMSNEWNLAVYKDVIEVHHCPVITGKKNSTDIALTIYAVQCSYDRPETDTYIIATNDKDFMPLANYLRKIKKQTVCLYLDDKCKSCIAFDKASQITLTPAKTETKEAKHEVKHADVKAHAAEIKPEKAGDPRQAAEKLAEYLNKYLKTPADKCYLATIGSNLADTLQTMKACTKMSQPSKAVDAVLMKYSDLFGKYKLIKNGKTYYIALKQ